MSIFTRFKLSLALKNVSRMSFVPPIGHPPHVRTILKAASIVKVQEEPKTSLDQCLLVIENQIHKKGKLTKNQLQDIVQALEKKDKLTGPQALLIIKCCGLASVTEKPEIRMDYLRQVWNYLKLSGVKLDASHYNAFLRVQIENEEKIKPNEFLQYMKTEGINPNRVTYQHLLTASCYDGDLITVTKILEEIKEANYPLNEYIFNALVLGHCVAGDIKGAEDIIDIMNDKKLPVNSNTYSMFLCGLARTGNVEKIKSILDECSEKDIYLSTDKIFEMIYYLFLNGQENYAVQKLKEVYSFNDLIILQYRLLHKKHYDGFLHTLDFLPDKIATVRLACRYLAFNEDVETIKQFSDICKKKEELQTDVLTTVIHYTLVNKTLDKSLQLIAEIQKSGQEVHLRYFVPLLKGAAAGNDVRKIIKLIRIITFSYGFELNFPFLSHTIFHNLSMDRKQLILLIDTLSLIIPKHVVVKGYISGCFSKNDLRAVLETTERCGLPRDITFIAEKSPHYLNKGADPKPIVGLLSNWVRVQKRFGREITDVSETSNGIPVDVQKTVDDLTVAIVEQCSENVVMDYLKTMLEKRLPISEKAAELIGNKSENEELKNLAAEVSQVKYEDMHENFVKRDGFVVPKSTENWNKFIGLKQLQDIDEMEKLFNEDIDLQTHAGFIYFIKTLLKVNNESKATEYLKKYYEIFSQNCKSCGKSLFLESAMVSRGMLKEAIMLIEKRELFSKSSHLILVETFKPVIENGTVDDLKEIFGIGKSKNLQIIEPQSVITHLLYRGDVERIINLLESSDFGLFKDVDFTHLIYRLYRSEDLAKMEKVIKILEENADVGNFGSYLLFLYACTKNFDKAQKFLDSEFVAPLQWTNNLESIPKEKRIDLLETMISILKGREKRQKTNLYELLMINYEGSDVAHEKGLDLWLQLQEENVQPTPLFLIVLARVLRSKNMEIPFDEPASEEKLSIVIPPSIPMDVKAKITTFLGSSRNNRNVFLSKFCELIIQNKLKKKDIEDILAANVDNEDFVYRRIFNNMLKSLKWKKALLNNSLDDVRNSPSIDLTDGNFKNSELVLFTGRLLLSISDCNTTMATIVVWAYMQNHPEFKKFVNLLEPKVRNCLKNQSILRNLLELVKYSKRRNKTITNLLNSDVFKNYSELQEEAEEIARPDGFPEEERPESEIELAPMNSAENYGKVDGMVEDLGNREKNTESASITQTKTETSGSSPNV